MANDIPILTVNAGSSSIRLAAFRSADGERMVLQAEQRYELGSREPSEYRRWIPKQPT